MAITCPSCGAQFDVTLFQFGRTVLCDCGECVGLERGHVRRMDGPDCRSRLPGPPDVQPPVGELGGEQTE